MDKEERRIFEMGLRNNISYEEERLNEIIKEGAIKDALTRLEIVRLASQSQYPEVLEKGLGYYLLLQKLREDLKIKYDEINSSKEEMKSLGNKILQKLPIPPASNIPTIMIITEDSKEWLNTDDLFGTNPN